MRSSTDRTSIEIVVVAAILVLIVMAGVNSQSLMGGVKCGASYISSICAALATE